MAEIVWTKQAYIERVSILSYGKDVFGEKAMRRLNDEIEKNIFLFAGESSDRKF